MKYWVYVVHWRSLSVEIVAECQHENEADLALAQHIASLPKDQLAEMSALKTIATTAVSEQMEAAVEQFRRINGRSTA